MSDTHLISCHGHDLQELQQLSDEVCELYRNVVRLTQKMNGTELEAYTDPVEFGQMDARELSFFFASMFVENPYEQQHVCDVHLDAVG